ncbi:MAG: hypothetical protein JSU95_06960 [Betaproteobacteria bacterium]|nr:MAG: hypothetical protein JSU95_06960 [Betaproteobacteria bacterium]
MAFRLRKRFVGFLLPVVLAFAQHTAMAHQVSHASDESSDPEQTLVHLQLCDKCVSAAKVTHLPAGPSFRVELLHGRYFHNAAVPTPFASVDCIAHACRDPPTLL